MAEPSGAEGRGLSDAEKQEVWLKHAPGGGGNERPWEMLCICCFVPWPCSTIRLLTETDRLAAELERGAAREAALREALEDMLDFIDHLDGTPERMLVNGDRYRKSREALAAGSSEGGE